MLELEELTKLDIAQAARDELKRLEDQQGRLDPRDVVDAARNPDSPLHSLFPWDDELAADAHRLNVARALIRRVKLVVRVDEQKFRVVQYVRDPQRDPKESGYLASTKVKSRSIATAVMLAEVARLSGVAKRAARLARLYEAKLPEGVCAGCGTILEAVMAVETLLKG